MTIKEALDKVEKVVSLKGDESDKEAFQVVKDNLNLNPYVSTDIVDDRFDNTDDYDDAALSYVTLSYDDCKAIAELANQYICNSSLFDEVEERIDMAIDDYLENEK